jgi:hypothetical protein
VPSPASEGAGDAGAAGDGGEGTSSSGRVCHEVKISTERAETRRRHSPSAAARAHRFCLNFVSLSPGTHLV